MAKKRKKGRSRRSYVGLEPTVTFTKTALGMPMVYGSLGAAARIPGTGPAISGVLPSMGTGFGLMGLTGVVQSAGGLMSGVRKLERVTKKKRKR